MNENELRAQIRNEILSELTFETFKSAKIATVICATVIVDDSSGTQAVCRFYLPNGLFIGEVPANKIITAENSAQGSL